MINQTIEEIDQHLDTIDDHWRELSRVSDLKGWRWLKPMACGRDYLRLAYLAAYLDEKLQKGHTDKS